MAYPQIIVKTRILFLKVITFLNRPSFYAWYVFLFFVIYFLITYMSLDKVFSLDDHFFHIRFAEILREKGISALTDFQSIYFSRMGMGHQYLVYYNFLFYLVLAPFTFLNPLVLGIKLYGVFALSVSFTIIYVFLKKVSVRLSFLWTLLFLVVLLQSNLLLRFTLARPFTLAPVFLVLMLYFIYQKKYWAMAIISFLYFYWHTATFIFPFCLAFGYFLFEQFYGKKPDWKLIGWSFFGTGGAVFLAYLISPGIVAYLKDVIFPVFFDTTLAKTTKIAEGSEVYGKDFFAILSSFFWFLAALFIVGAYEILRYVEAKRGLQNQEDEPDLSIQPLRATLFVASLIFLAASSLSGRFLDYFAYFCLLYIAIAASDVAKFFKINGKLFRRSFLVGGSIVVFYLIVNLSLNFYDSLASSRSHLIAQAPAEWLNANEKQDKIIFNVDWDSFPVLYYFTGDKFFYVTGLEPRFLYDLDPKKYWIWNNIGSGIYCEKDDCSEIIEQRKTALLKDENRKNWYKYEGNLIADAIQTNFKTDVIVASIRRNDLSAVMDNSSRFEKKFFDDKNSAYAVYQIIN
jgi:hypothetical protein